MTTVFILYLIAVALGVGGMIALPRHFRQFCLTPRSLCGLCASAHDCPVRHLKMKLILEPRNRLIFNADTIKVMA